MSFPSELPLLPRPKILEGRRLADVGGAWGDRISQGALLQCSKRSSGSAFALPPQFAAVSSRALRNTEVPQKKGAPPECVSPEENTVHFRNLKRNFSLETPKVTLIIWVA